MADALKSHGGKRIGGPPATPLPPAKLLLGQCAESTRLLATVPCAQAALAVCAQQVESQNELTLFQTWQSCLQTNCAAATTDEAYLDCMRTFCLPSYADCYTGGTYGVGECGDIDGCAQSSCAPPITSACIRGCMSEATADAVVEYFDLTLCAQGACADSVTDAEFQACFQQAISAPVCAEPYMTCLGAEG